MTQSEDRFLSSDGQLIKAAFFNTPLRPDEIVPEEEIKEMGIPAAAHFRNGLEYRIGKEETVSPELEFASFSEIMDRTMRKKK